MGYPPNGPADLPGLVPNSEGFMLDVELAIMVGFATILSENRPASVETPLRVLEVGCFKGRTTSALLHVPHTCVTAIDDFKGPRDMPEAERQGLREAFERNLANAAGLHRERFKGAIATLPEGHGCGFGLRVLEGDSVGRMEWLLDQGETFDLILIDADHSATSVERDARAAWPLLAEGGYLFFDDIDWRTVQQGLYAWTTGAHFPHAIRSTTPKLGYVRKVEGRPVT